MTNTATFVQEDVVADLSDRWDNRIAVYFPYDRNDVAAVKTVPGRRFVGKDDLEDDSSDVPYWTVPKDMMSARALRDAFGDRLKLTNRLQEWGWLVKRRESMLGSLADAMDAELERLTDLLPGIAEKVRGYQRAGIKFISEGQGALIADQPGLGKTLQAIGGLAEAGKMDEDGNAFLVIAPATSLEVTWEKELAKWQPHQSFIAVGSREEREAIIQEFMDAVEFGATAWLVVNPEMVRYRTQYDTTGCLEHDESSTNSECKDCPYCQRLEVREYDIFNELEFDAVVIDESHQSIRNKSTLTARGIHDLNLLPGAKKIAMTGTPITNRVIDLWGVLNWLDPETYSSKWRWAERFCEISDNGYGKVIGELRDDTQEAFFESLKPYVLRRTKREVAPDLPPKNHIPVDLGFASSAHETQYRQFQAEAYLKIAEMELSATGVLDELTRLRQFAIARCDVEQEARPDSDEPRLVVRHTAESAKVEWLDEHLEELGILHDGAPNGGDEKIVIFSQFVSVIRMLRDHYDEKGLRVGEISGRISQPNRREAVREFQEGDLKVMLVSTKAGGVSIELDAADEVVFMDETWNHSDMEQAEDRVHRANKGRTKQVNIYILRTEDTVETDVVMPKVINKKEISRFVMDVRRGIDQEN